MQDLISKTVEFSKGKKQSKIFLDFVEIFYLQNQAKDFNNFLVEDFYNFAHSSFDLFQTKNNGEVKVRVVNLEASNATEYSLLEVTSDDKPFLVDSIMRYCEKIGLEVKNIIHPILLASRDKSGQLKTVENKTHNESSLEAESIIQVQLTKISDKIEIENITKDIHKLLANISLVVEDWQKMVSATKNLSTKIDKIKNSSQNVNELKDFITWVTSGNFIFLGFSEFDFKKNAKDEYCLEVVGEPLGVFRSSNEDFRPNIVNGTNQEINDSVHNPYVIEILKSRYKSQIHRFTNAERIRIQKFSKDGDVIGEYRIIGLFTSVAYSQNTASIPLVRDKIARIIKASGFTKSSHNYKDLISVLENYPRDELFQISECDLFRIAIGLVMVCGRPQVKFFARKDKFNRFVSCLVFAPRERSNSDLREKMRDYLADKYNGSVVDSFVHITESNLTRFHLIIRTDNGIPDLNEDKIEDELTKMARIWSDDLKEEIQNKFGKEAFSSLFKKYKNSFSISYCNRFDVRRAAIDISRIEDCLKENNIVFNLYNSSTSPKDVIELKIYSAQRELILSDVMPILESFGFSVIHEHTYVVNIAENNKVWINYFLLNLSKTRAEYSEKLKNNFEETISLITRSVTNAGSLNRLLVAADLNWKQIYMIRSYVKYIYQAGYRNAQEYVANILVVHSNITKLLVELFETKFDPSLHISLDERKQKVEAISNQIKNLLNKVSDASHDNAIRKFLGVINATLRTNYYQTNNDGEFKGYMSFKFDCKNVPDLPLPLPYAEIFVYSSDTEGVHLRGGKVARGGLRWSDRHEDFRTEVLGLMKAQMTKNAVIVPVGSKGGFIVKKDISKMTRDEIQQAGINSYKTFLRGLLDITDNVINGKIIHPQNVVMFDEADPYLVVAADKGTATFSDIANSISAEYNFWLGDAFASGGSVGYDHKKMGITAKGAWISVQRHFREMGIDTQSQDFTCVGIGDLAGDVFGNGMLLSKHIRLVAAFNHMHIFLDPNPDAAKSFAERERIFNLPRSTWMDYNKSLISQGGGIFERSAKSIALTPQVKEVLAIEKDELTPNELINAILKAPVDLLWNGGIGTYVKAADETNVEVGDRANDAYRINGSELRCKVVGEGGNLGFTQKGRIEYAFNSGRINTDAMDNSAGVDCSDHEVNIKIALMQALRLEKISLDERNKILEQMTDNVSDLVLNDNFSQTQAISVAQSLGVLALSSQAQFLDSLEKTGLLNRKIEFLPSTKEINKRQIDKIGMTRPELCVMLAYAKMDIYNKILSSDLVDDKYFDRELKEYFPKLMQEKFASEISSHQLRREIIATQITNFVVNKIGITFVNQLANETGFTVSKVIRSFIIAADAFKLRDIWLEIENLAGKVSAKIQTQMILSPSRLLERSVLWLLRSNQNEDLTTIINRLQKLTGNLAEILVDVMAPASREAYEAKIQIYTKNNVPQKLAEKIAAMDPIASAFDIAEIASKTDLDLKSIAKIYFAIGNRFSLKWLRNRLNEVSIDGHWQKLSSKTVLEDLYSYQMKLALQIIHYAQQNQTNKDDLVENWVSSVNSLIVRYDNFVEELKTHPSLDMSMFIVALNRLKPLVN